MLDPPLRKSLKNGSDTAQVDRFTFRNEPGVVMELQLQVGQWYQLRWTQ